MNNVWDEGRWKKEKGAKIDFMTQYIFQHIERFVDFKGKAICELGCGTGRLSFLAHKKGAESITLVDSSDKAIELARGLFSNEPNVEIIKSDIFQFVPQKQYDIVFSSGLIEHFKDFDRERIVKAHLNLAKEIVILVHPSDTIYNQLRWHLPISQKLYGWQRAFSRNELSKICISLGVKEEITYRFHLCYAIPFLHNNPINKKMGFLEKYFGGLYFSVLKK